MARIDSATSSVRVPPTVNATTRREATEVVVDASESFTASPSGDAGGVDLGRAARTVFRAAAGNTDMNTVTFYPNCAVNEAPAPALVGNLLVIPGEKGIAAFDVTEGTMKWMRETTGHYNYSVGAQASPDGTRVFFLDGNTGTMTAVDPMTGEKAWAESCHGPRLTPVAVSPDSKAVFFGDNDTLRSHDAATGTNQWSKPLHVMITIPPAVSPDGKTVFAADSHAVRRKGAVYASTFYALDTTTGDENWKVELDRKIACVPVVARDGTVIVADEGGTIHAFEGSSGKPLWRERKGMQGTGDCFALLLAPDETTLYGTVQDTLKGGRAFALDLHRSGADRVMDGVSTRWQTPRGEVVHAPALSRDRSVLYVGSDDMKLRALGTQDGQEKWVMGTAGRVYDPAVSADGTTLYVTVGTGDSNPHQASRLAIVDAATGIEKTGLATTENLVAFSGSLRDDIVYRPRESVDKVSLSSAPPNPAPAVEKLDGYILVGGVKVPVRKY